MWETNKVSHSCQLIEKKMHLCLWYKFNWEVLLQQYEQRSVGSGALRILQEVGAVWGGSWWVKNLTKGDRAWGTLAWKNSQKIPERWKCSLFLWTPKQPGMVGAKSSASGSQDIEARDVEWARLRRVSNATKGDRRSRYCLLNNDVERNRCRRDSHHLSFLTKALLGFPKCT
jgi:hypothetical protein